MLDSGCILVAPPPFPALLAQWASASPRRARTPAEEDALAGWADEEASWGARWFALCGKHAPADATPSSVAPAAKEKR